jgi:hypothetical protein
MLAMLPATSILLASSLRLERVAPTLLAAYVALVAETSALTLTLSPFREVKRGPLALGEAALLAVAFGVWWRRGRPRLVPAGGARAIALAVRDPVIAAFLVVVAAALAYELVLVLTVPANNWDSLTYHLSRAAAWVQHGGVYWIPNAPTDRMNEFQALAEQNILFLFVATGKGALFALPQYIAQLACLVGIYETARRLGFDTRRALLSALLFASFTLVALEATTAQNDLVAASLPLAATALLLGGSWPEVALAGVAAGLGIGVKLTTALVLPVLALFALRLGHRRAVGFGLAGVVGFVTLGMWSFVLNIAETGHVLGHGGGRVEQTASPSFPGSLATAARISLRFIDRSGFSSKVVEALVLVAVATTIALVIAWRRQHRSWRSTITTAATFGLALLAPIFVAGLAILNELQSSPVHFHYLARVNSRVDEDVSSFGPLGVLLLGVSIVTVARFRRCRDDGRLLLALALPVFIVALALTSRYNPWLSRFLIVPVALTAPLLGPVFGRRSATLGIVIVAATTIGVTLVRNELKPIDGTVRPWQLTAAEAVELQSWKPAAAIALRQIDAVVPPRACVGVLLDVNEPSYVLYGPKLGRRVMFMPAKGAPQAAESAGVPYVVIGSGAVAPLVDGFRAGGWTLRPLDPRSNYWTLAISPRGGSGRCRSATADEQAKASSG